MWDYIRRQGRLAVDANRAAHLISLRAKDPRRLEAREFKTAASVLGVPAAHLAAFYYVESSGEGFGSDGRLKLLYEPHIVHRATKGALTGKKFDWIWNGREIKIDLSYRNWVPLSGHIQRNPEIWHPYKENHAGQWGLMAMAYEHHDAAIEGGSYGGFQVLGQNARWLGYESPIDMIETMYEGEGTHLEAAIRFLRQRKLIPALKAGNWTELAAGYNGPGQAQTFAAKLQRESGRMGSALA